MILKKFEILFWVKLIFILYKNSRRLSRFCRFTLLFLLNLREINFCKDKIKTQRHQEKHREHKVVALCSLFNLSFAVVRLLMKYFHSSITPNFYHRRTRIFRNAFSVFLLLHNLPHQSSSCEMSENFNGDLSPLKLAEVETKGLLSLEINFCKNHLLPI